jgi:hypothetical protein
MEAIPICALNKIRGKSGLDTTVDKDCPVEFRHCITHNNALLPQAIE